MLDPLNLPDRSFEPFNESEDDNPNEDTCRECGVRGSLWAHGLCGPCNRSGMGGDRDK